MLGGSRKPLARRTPLRRGKPLSRRPAHPRPHNTAPLTRPRDTGFSPETRATIDGRDHGRCLVCGQPATNIQHRVARGMGGTRDPRINGAANGLSLCGSGTTGHHGWFERHRRVARLLGYGALQSDLPRIADIPVLTRDGWQLFDDEGNRSPCPPDEYPFTPGEEGFPCLPG